MTESNNFPTLQVRRCSWQGSQTHVHSGESFARTMKINENFIGGVAIDLNEHALSITHSWMAMAFLLR